MVAGVHTAEMVEGVLRKGSPLGLEGRLAHRWYGAKDGTKRYVAEVVVNEFQHLPGKREEAAAA